MLCLLDIDGTLFRGAAEHRAALVAAIEETWEVRISPESVEALDYAGRTDRWIARRLLEGAGVDGGGFEERIGTWERIACEAFARMAPRSMSERLIDGAAEAVERLRSEGLTTELVTGNLEPIAHAKMDRCGIGEAFTPGMGGYGSDAEERDRLVPIALRRAGDGDGPWPPERAVVIGDTPRDIACARAAGARAVAVTTGPYRAPALTGADAVVPDLRRAAELVVGWA